ncbi:MAG: hypothetical protein LC745_08470 [Planctomycetia bacterium]|nr:hypothetical protein [Planctomycetia bacterium]
MTSTAYYGSILAAGLAVVVVALLYWQRTERRGRGTTLSDEDRSHFDHQDIRRRVVAGVMSLLALGVYLGSRTPPHRDGRPNKPFFIIWLGVFALVLPLLILAMLDWLATRDYARRHRRVIVREGMEILRDEMRLHGNRPGKDVPPEGPDVSPHE